MKVNMHDECVDKKIETITHLASVGLYVTSYLSTLSMEVAQDTLTDVGFKKVTVMFSGIPGPPGIDPAKKYFYYQKKSSLIAYHAQTNPST